MPPECNIEKALRIMAIMFRRTGRTSQTAVTNFNNT